MNSYIVYMMHQLVLLAACVSLTSSAITVSTSPFTPVPCHVTKDSTYHGASLDCTHRDITSLPLPEQWFPPSVTSLFLDYNSIAELNNKSFSFMTASRITLRLLSLSNNKIYFIAPSVFSGLVSLESLDLNYNNINLDRGSINGRAFHGLGNLLHLDVRNNNMYYKSGRYPDGLFRYLRSLISLSLETFLGDLDFGSLFNTTKRLSSLSLSGGMHRITNNSFESFSEIHLKELFIEHPMNLNTTDSDAFRYFTFLDSYTHRGGSQHIAVTLESFAPFSGRNMSRIHIDQSNYYHLSVPNIFIHNTVITKYMVRYLSKICIEDFSMVDNNIFILESNPLINGVWGRCIKSMDISGNPFMSGLNLWFVEQLFNLERLLMTGRKNYFISYKTTPTWRPFACVSTVQSSPSYLKQGADEAVKNNDSQLSGNMIHLSKFTDKSDPIHHSPVSKEVKNLRAKTYRHLVDEYEQFRDQSNIGPIITITIPKPLKLLNLNSVSNNVGPLDTNVKLIGGENLQEIHLADSGIHHFTGSICGLSNLTLFDISKNDGSVMSHTFFNCMPTLVYLNMADMNLDTTFMASYSDQLFKCLTELTTLDISNNDLHYLTAAIFATNYKLSVLDLAGNRFQEIPFNLENTPRLCYLDMRNNSLRTISENDIASLERHADTDTVNTFSLKLDGNEFFCGCKSIKFLSWLQVTKIDLDNNRNYSCISDSGIRQSTGQIKDIEAMWRFCNGEKALWISIILSLLFVLGFGCFILIPKSKTQLVAFIMRTFRAQFMMKTSVDYPIGVYIGYADQDMELACQRLRHFVEERLHLSTYVRHRDLLPASDIAESIVENVHASWRVLLIVSKHFLNDPWSYFLLKAAPYAVQVENPGLIVLVVIDDDNDGPLWSRFPNGFLQAVVEENIITMTSNGNISYEDKQALKTALLN